MPTIVLPDDGEENWSGELRAAILAVNSVVDATAAKVQDYDDLPSLTLIFESATT